MNRFIEVEDGYLSIDEISSLQRKRTGVEMLIAITKDGCRHKCTGSADHAELALWPVIPALPGFTLLTMSRPEKDEDPTEEEMVARYISRDTIIGWRITNHDPLPITANDGSPICDSNEYAIACPDGSIAIMGEVTVATVEEFVRHVCALWELSTSSLVA